MLRFFPSSNSHIITIHVGQVVRFVVCILLFVRDVSYGCILHNYIRVFLHGVHVLKWGELVV